MLVVLIAVLGALFRNLFLPGQIVFSNDGPLGRLAAACHELPGRFIACWEDLNSVGISNWAAPPNISYGLQFVLGPYLFSKLYVIIALLILGFGAWCFFRQTGLTPVACILGGLAATLNSGFLSVAAWGVASHTITVGLTFFALAALADTTSRWRWLRVILAGFAVGMGVSEGADVGAMFSVLVAAYVVYSAFVREGPKLQNVVAGFGRTVLIAVCAVLLAAQAITGLISTDIEGKVGMEQDAETRASRWVWATQWSLPKSEVLALAVPGLFGYRMDSPEGGSYWGGVGRDPAWDTYVEKGSEGKPPKGFKRFSGGGSYAGVLVLLLAIWATTQVFRRGNSIFNLSQRKLLWFWIGVALVCLILSLGRFAPFYRLVYMLPYFSTMRNPVKFLNIFSFATIVLFAYGVDGLCRGYMQAGPNSRWAGLATWWRKAAKFDQRWLIGCLSVLGLSLVAWLIYSSNSSALERYMVSVQIEESIIPSTVAFSIRQVGWFVLFFALATGLLALIFSGAFTARRMTWGALFLGLILAVDLGRANLPWILFWDKPEKYSSNPIIDKLREDPHKQRVCFLPFNPPAQYAMFTKLYQGEWLPHLFPYYNIQSIEVVQMSRLPEDLSAYEKAFHPNSDSEYPKFLTRLWQLSNNRYILGAAGYIQALNDRFDPTNRSFHIVQRFNIQGRPGVKRASRLDQLTVALREDGPYALMEYDRALPRAKLYGSWSVNTNEAAVLATLSDDKFDPHQSVVVAGGLPPGVADAGTNQNTGVVDFVGYSPKKIVLKSESAGPGVLLLNDHYDPHWKVTVDGQPARLLRCNFIMRGVYLDQGNHTIEFRFQPPLGPLYLSLAAIGAAVVLLGVVVVGQRRDSASAVESPARARVNPEPVAAAAAPADNTLPARKADKNDKSGRSRRRS